MTLRYVLYLVVLLLYPHRALYADRRWFKILVLKLLIYYPCFKMLDFKARGLETTVACGVQTQIFNPTRPIGLALPWSLVWIC